MSEPDDRLHPHHAEALADLTRVVEAVQTHTGLTSRWNGSLQVRGLDFGFSGQKHRSCSISIREDVLLTPAYRWSTMIHEALHSVSGAFAPPQPDAASDQWEEAIAEQTQRLLRAAILAALGVDVPDADLDDRDQFHPYNSGIRRLEGIRVLLGREPLPFYLVLMAASTRQRARSLIEGLRNRRRGEE